MTRWTFVLFTKLWLWQSTEFNWGMAPYRIDETGGAALKLLPKLKADSFATQILLFNSENHNYELEELSWYQEWHMTPVHEYDKSKDDWIVDHLSNAMDLTQDYFRKYFSDYLYIKNDSDKAIAIRCEDWEHEIEPGGWIVTNYNSEIANEDWVVFSSLTYTPDA